MARRMVMATLGLLALSLIVPPPTEAQWTRGDFLLQDLLYQPYPVREAARLGIWPGMVPGEPDESRRSFTRRIMATYEISNAANPYFLRGDFDSDGAADLALLVRERSTDRTGLAIIPGSLESVHLIGVGPASPARAEGWRVVSLGIDGNGSGEGVVVGLRGSSGISIRWDGESFQTSPLEGTAGERTEPELVGRAREMGLWPDGRYEVLWNRNPAYIRGDFNGDGELDAAVQVRDTSNGERGIVIVHSTLDRLYALLGQVEGGGITDAGKILLIPKGEVLSPFTEQEPQDPIELDSDAIWAGWPGGPYSGAWYWKDDGYRWVTLSD